MNMHFEEGETFPPARSAHVLAIVNEALSNVARHSQAHHTWIVAERTNGHLTLSVADDGVGFSAQGVEARLWAAKHAGSRSACWVAPSPSNSEPLEAHW